MAVITWDGVGERLFETGVDRGVLYPPVGDGVPWNGLISVEHSPTGGEARPFFIDGYKYQNRSRPDDFAGTIQAYTYPEEFEDCNGLVSIGSGLSMGFQTRKSFGLCYRTTIGNDVSSVNHGHKIHMVYNALAAPASQNYQTISENPEATPFSWSITTKPMKVAGRRATPYMVVDTTKTPPPLLAELEAIIYGSSTEEPRLPSPTELVAMFAGAPTLFVVDNGDGTFTVSGPDALVRLLDANRYQFDADSVVNNGDGTFDISSF